MAEGYWGPYGWVETGKKKSARQAKAAKAREDLRRRAEEKRKEEQRKRLLREAAEKKRATRSREVAASSAAKVAPLPQHDLPSSPKQDRQSRTDRRVEYQLKRAPRGKVRQPRELSDAERARAERFKEATPKELLDRFGFAEASQIRRQVGQANVEENLARTRQLKEMGLKQEAREAPPRPGLLEDAFDLAKQLLPGESGQKGARLAGLPLPRIVETVGGTFGKAALGAAQDPVRVLLEQPIEMGLGITRGIGQLATTDPNEMFGTAKNFVDATREHYRSVYGEGNVRGNEFSIGLDALAAVNAAATTVGVAKRVGAGMPVRQAYRATRFPELDTFLSPEKRFRMVASPRFDNPARLLYGQSYALRGFQDAFDAVVNRLPEDMPVIGRNTRVARYHGRQAQINTMSLRNGALADIAAISDGALTTWTDDLMADMFGTGTRVTPQGRRIALEYELPYKYRAVTTGDNSGLERLREFYVRERDRYFSTQPFRNQTQQLAYEAFDNRIRMIDEALQVDALDPKVQAAIKAMDDLNAKNVQIKLKNASRGDAKMLEKLQETFDQRSRLIGREVFLEPDAPGGYLPHMTDPMEMGRHPAGKGVRGPTIYDTGDWTWGQNEFVRFSQAKNAVDPRLLLEDFQRTTSIAGMDNIRLMLWRSGKKLNVWEVDSLSPAKREELYLVRRRGTMPPEAVHHTDLGELEEGLRRYVDETIVPANLSDAKLAELGWKVETQPGVYVWAEIPDMVVVRKKDADKLLRYFTGNNARVLDAASTVPVGAWDFGLNLTRATLLYTNPGYYMANLAGNMVFKFAERGIFALEDGVRTMNLMMDRPQLYRRLAAEAGEGFATSPLKRTKIPQTTKARRRFEQLGQRPIQWIGEKAGAFVDAPMRVSQLVAELRAYGYREWDEIEALFDSTDETAKLVRNAAVQRMRSKMVDFSQMEPWERNWLARVLLVYPWQRGVTKYVLNYAAAHPARTVALGLWAQAVNDEWERRMGNAEVPLWLMPYWPTEPAEDGKVKMRGFGSVSPADSVIGIAATVATVLGWDKFPEFGVDTPFDYMQPLFQDIFLALRSRNEYDQPTPLLEALGQNLASSTVPFYRTLERIRRGGSKLYTERSPAAQAWREANRFASREVDLVKAEESARRAGTAKKPREEYLAEKWIRENETEKLTPQLRDRIETGYRNKALYETRRDELARELGGDTSERDRVFLLGDLLDIGRADLERVASEYAAAKGDDLTDVDGATWRLIADDLQELFYDSSILNEWESQLREAKRGG